MIDICTVTWNRKIRIERLIDTFSVRGEEVQNGHRFVIVDNGSQDDTHEYLLSQKERLGDKIVVIKLDEKVPVSQAFNQSLEWFSKHGSDYVFLCHSDLAYGYAIDDKDPLDALVLSISRSDGTDILSPLSDRIQPHLQMPKNKKLYDKTKDTFQFNSVAVMISRKVVETVGFFDPEYEFFFYDMDYSRRALEKGFKIKLHRGVFFPHPTPEPDEIIKEAVLSQVESEQLAIKDGDYYNKKWKIFPAAADVFMNRTDVGKVENALLFGKIVFPATTVAEEKTETGTFRFSGTLTKLG